MQCDIRYVKKSPPDYGDMWWLGGECVDTTPQGRKPHPADFRFYTDTHDGLPILVMLSPPYLNDGKPIPQPQGHVGEQ